MAARDSASREPLLAQQNQQHGTYSATSATAHGQALEFKYTVHDLAPLTDPTDPTLPRQMGGIDEICQGLRVDPKVGLHSDETLESYSTGHSDQTKFATRSKHFGRNVSLVILSLSSTPASFLRRSSKRIIMWIMQWTLLVVGVSNPWYLPYLSSLSYCKKKRERADSPAQRIMQYGESIRGLHFE